MASLNTSKYASARGFSLLEMLVVIGMASILGGLALFASMDAFHGTNFRSERDMLVGLIQHARAQAVHNVCTGSGCTNGLPHGIRFDTDTYTLFQGGTYVAGNSTNAVFEANTAFPHAGSLAGSEVIFSQLSGTTSCSACTFSLADTEGHTSTITVTGEGQIVWTH
jgi:prepilin-type N-terminal cleavage/methylation domain-containing protein